MNIVGASQRDLCQITDWSLFLLFTKRFMADNQMFHIYERGTNKVVRHSMTVDELEQLMAEKKIDWLRWEIQPCYTRYEFGDASF